MFTNLVEMLNHAAKTYRDKIIYRDVQGQTKSISFEDFNKLTLSIGTGLASYIDYLKVDFAPMPIAVMTGRHIGTPACFLGVARTGNFYAPMDSELPIPRLVQIMKVSRPPYLIVDEESLEKAEDVLTELSKDADYGASLPHILNMEELMNTSPDAELMDELEGMITEFTPLYMIFTSGSTGNPKGVLTNHHALLCYLDALNDVIHLDKSDVLGNQSPLDYIAAVRDMYLPLLSGGETVIIPSNTTAMPSELFALLNEYKVTTLCWSASGLEVLARLGGFEEGSEVPKYVKRIVFSGSVMSGKYLKIWKDALPGTLFINQYGPTEATASCTYYTVPDNITEETVLPIGKPYKHYRVFLMDEDKLVARGEVGEICVSGPTLAIGYYDNPTETNKAFTFNPLISAYQERIYKTGDLGKINENGDIEFLGRKDRQIKHMGHRIELAEIETAAYKVEGITQAISMYDQAKGLLYLFYTGDATPKDIAIRFREDMPSYMVPRKIVTLDEIPTLHNGKVDMPALKAMMK